MWAIKSTSTLLDFSNHNIYRRRRGRYPLVIFHGFDQIFGSPSETNSKQVGICSLIPPSVGMNDEVFSGEEPVQPEIPIGEAFW